MNKIKVLIFPAGSINAIDMYQSLAKCVNIEVYGASSKIDHADFIYPRNKLFIGNYNVSDKNFILNFNKLLDKHKINVVVPTHDTIAKFFAINKEDFHSKILVADAMTAEICRSKKKIFELFKSEDFIPRIYDLDEVKNNDFPLFLKPDIGEGAKGTYLVNTIDELNTCLKNDSSLVICEYLPNEEFTVDCFTDRHGKLKFVGMRSRGRVTNGVSHHSESLKLDYDVERIASIINNKLNFLGAWYFQVKRDRQNNYKLLEISCRQSGTMTLHRHKGINFTLLGVYETMGIDTNIIENPYNIILDRGIYSKFRIDYKYEWVYIDFDDTIIVDKKVNLEAISFIYQCLNNNIGLTLLTKHENKTINETLDFYHIDSRLFDEIVEISPTELKSDYIKKKNAIFIDNRYIERKEVYDKHHIPVFDVDIIDTLLN